MPDSTDATKRLVHETAALRRDANALQATADRFRRACAPTMQGGTGPVPPETAAALGAAVVVAPALLTEALYLLLPLARNEDVRGLQDGIRDLQERQQAAGSPMPDDVPALVALLNGISKSMVALEAERPPETDEGRVLRAGAAAVKDPHWRRRFSKAADEADAEGGGS